MNMPIRPNQRKILGLVSATPDDIARARVTALHASRINNLLSIPTLMGMTAYMHGLPFWSVTSAAQDNRAHGRV